MKNKLWVYINGYRVVETKSIGYKWVRYRTSENSLFKRIKRSEWDKACIRPLEEQQHRTHIYNLANKLNISNVKKSRKKFFFRDPVPLRKRYLKDRYVLLCTTRTCSGMWKSRLEYGDNHIEKNFCFRIRYTLAAKPLGSGDFLVTVLQVGGVLLTTHTINY